MNICVTGTAGFIGSAVAERLLQRGDTVVGIDNLNDYYDVALKEAGARYYEWPSRALAPEQAPREGEVFVRLVCSFATDPADVARFVAICAQITKG